jgi:hypothetical protein
VLKGFDADMQWPIGASEAGLWAEGSFGPSGRNEHGIRENPTARLVRAESVGVGYLNF